MTADGAMAEVIAACRPEWAMISDARHPAAAFDDVAQRLTGDLDLATRRVFRAAIDARERITTTALGGGIAIPHARMALVGAARIAIARFPAGLDLGARDALPVDLVVMLMTREEDHPGHLRLLARVAARLADRGRRDALRAAEAPAGLVAAFLA